jgi:hypothetical protein
MIRLHTYALIKALFDQSKDYFDALCPLALGVLDESSFSDLTTIQDKLKKSLSIDVPIHILKTVCGRAKAGGYAEQETNTRNFKITKKGRDYINSLEPVAEVERRTNAFLASLITFSSSKGETLNQQQAQKLVESFIQDNLDGVIDFINPKQSTEDRSKVLDRKDGALMVEFIKDIQNSKPDEYKEFTELVFGSILSSLLSAETSSDITEAEERKLKRATIFFDTNIAFSLLGFHSDESNTAAKELFGLLKSLNFPLKVFDFTLDEICRVVNAYISNKNRFPKDLPVDHIYSILRKKNWGASDVSDFISNIEEKFQALGIEILQTGINLEDYKSPNNESLRPKIAATKREDNRGLSTSHDLAAVDKIRELRKKTVRRIEDAEAFFLTSDFGLQRTVLLGLGHRDSGTLTEVVLDRVLANILWLKNPKLNLPLSTIIATHSRDLLIDRRVWDKFYTVLGKLRTEGTITEGQVENLFYRNNVANLLQEFGRGDAEKVDEALVMEAVEEATKSLSEKEQAELAARASVEKELFETQTEQDKELQEHNTRLINVKRGLRQEARRGATLWITLIIVIVLIVLIALEFLGFKWLILHMPTSYTNLFNNVYGGIGILALTATCTGAWFLRKNLIPRIQDLSYKRLLKRVKLEE